MRQAQAESVSCCTPHCKHSNLPSPARTHIACQALLAATGHTQAVFGDGGVGPLERYELSEANEKEGLPV